MRPEGKFVAYETVKRGHTFEAQVSLLPSFLFPSLPSTEKDDWKLGGVDSTERRC